jgi:hypothetical protein
MGLNIITRGINTYIPLANAFCELYSVKRNIGPPHGPFSAKSTPYIYCPQVKVFGVKIRADFLDETYNVFLAMRLKEFSKNIFF